MGEPPIFRARQWNGAFAPLSLAAYVTWLAVALGPFIDWLDGRLRPGPLTPAGAMGMLAVLALFVLRSRCKGIGAAALRRMRIIVLLQAPAALLACRAFDGGTMPVLLIIVAGQLAVLYPPRTTLLLMLPVDAALALILALRWSWSETFTGMLSYAGFQLFAGLVAAYARSAEESRDEALQINGELLATRQLLLESARGEERLRLSRELHDVVGHKLTALRMQLRLLVRDAAPAPRDIAHECERLAEELLTDVRGVVGALRADDGIDLQQALAALVPPLPHPRVRLEIDGAARVADLAQAQALLRCAQEGLTNALRHSGADNIVIRLAPADDGVLLSVEDDGSARTAPPPGNGLRGMRERLEALGGSLRLHPGTGGGHGLSLQAWLPLPGGLVITGAARP
jgi:signal transduction histidine kinase